VAETRGAGPGGAPRPSAPAAADPREVLAALGVRAAGTPVPVRGGQDTALWRFRTADGAVHALRLFRPEQTAAAARERAAMDLARAGGVPVPAVEAAGVWRGRAALVLAWAPGETLAACLLRRPWDLWRLGVRFGGVQARLHRVGVPAAPPAFAPGGWLRLAGPEHGELIERLAAARPAGDTLIHLDYHPLNVLTDGRCITAVLDWTNAALGDRRADVARTAAILAMAPLPPTPLRPLLRVVRPVLAAAWRHGYARVAGWPDGLAPYLAWAGAVVLHEMTARAGRPEVGVTGRDLARMRRWITSWHER
jgi:aminoglycoside phosphotransferase (APT) family kinase protein